MNQPGSQAWMAPFLQYIAQGGMGGGNQGANPFFNIYSPAPPGTSQTVAFPSPIAPPQSPPPPLQPPPTSATVSPMPTAPGASPIGQIPPLPAGATSAGQGAAAIPAPSTAAVSPAVVPPFQSAMPQAPRLQPFASALTPQQGTPPPPGSTGAGSATTTWMWQPGFAGGQFTVNGQAGTPKPGDMVQVPGGPMLPYSQWLSTYGPSQQPQSGGGDRGAPNMGGGINAQPGGGPPGLGDSRTA